MSEKILALDPGESTGWVFCDGDADLLGGTIPKDHGKVATLIQQMSPDIIVVERFNLFPHMAKHMTWNTFYPCEVIGVIKYIASMLSIIVCEQAPADKKFAGGYAQDWYNMKGAYNLSEHTKDAYLHLKYFMRNRK